VSWFDIYIVRFFCVGLLLISADAVAQKKKRGADDAPSAGTRLREAEFYFTEGEKFFILEDYSKALTYYQKTLEITPDNATVYYKIAEVLSQSNRPEDMQKAASSVDNALKLEKKNKYFYLLGANIYASLARFDRAAQIYETMIAEVKGTEEYFFELAAVYQYANKTDDAFKAYQRAEAALGINEVSSLQKAAILLDAGKNREALAEGEKLMDAFPGDERLVIGFTEMLSQKNLTGEAIRFLEKFIEQNPEAENTKMILASLYRDNGQEHRARPLLSALFQDPEVDINSKLIILGGYAAELKMSRSKNPDEQDKQNFAEDLLFKLLTAETNNPHVHIVGGDLYLAGGKLKEAQKEYLAAIKAGEVNFEVWENLLYIETQLDEYQRLIEHSDQALELFPNHGMLYYFNGYGHLRQRNHRDAIAAFEQAKRLSAANASLVGDLNALLGEAYYGLKEFEKSDKAFEEALSYNPMNATALNNYSFYLAMRKSNLEKAEKMSAQLVKDYPDNPAFLDTHAWVLYTRGKFREARKVIERAIGSGKASAVHFEHYGDILYKLGEVDAAVMQWEKAKGMNANNEELIKKIANRKMYE
jgi:tetratricopeptide (TPR) repeat protein